MFLWNTSFAVKLQRKDWRPETLWDKKWQRYIGKTFPKFYKKLSCWSHRGNLRVGVQNIVFSNIFWKESLVNTGYSRVAVCATQTCNFIKKPYREPFLENFPNFLNQFFFTTFPFVLRNEIKWVTFFCIDCL